MDIVFGNQVILASILSNFESVDLVQCYNRICKTWYKVIKSNYFWTQYIAKHYFVNPGKLETLSDILDTNVEHVYQLRIQNADNGTVKTLGYTTLPQSSCQYSETLRYMFYS